MQMHLDQMQMHLDQMQMPFYNYVFWRSASDILLTYLVTTINKKHWSIIIIIMNMITMTEVLFTASSHLYKAIDAPTQQNSCVSPRMGCLE